MLNEILPSIFTPGETDGQGRKGAGDGSGHTPGKMATALTTQRIILDLLRELEKNSEQVDRREMPLSKYLKRLENVLKVMETESTDAKDANMVQLHQNEVKRLLAQSLDRENNRRTQKLATREKTTSPLSSAEEDVHRDQDGQMQTKKVS